MPDKQPKIKKMPKAKTINMGKNDLFYAAINGFIFGALIPIVLNNLGLKITGEIYLLVVAAFTALAVVGVLIGFYLSRLIGFFYQLAKFCAVGAANFAVDFGVLNLLIFFTGLASGLPFTIFKSVSFIVAVTNSFFWNKLWTFQKKSGESASKDFAQFILVSFVGLLLNAGIASLIVNLVGPLSGISEKTWANIGTAVASVAVLTWNFLGYKFIVFKK